MEDSIGLIVIGTLLQIVLCNLLRGDIAIVDFQLTVLLFIEDMTVVEQRLHLNLRLVVEHIGTVIGNGVLIDGDIVILRQLEDIGEEVHLLTLRLYRIVESGIGILREVDLTVDVTTPHHIFRHIDSRGERYLCPDGHCRRRALRLLLLLLSLRLTSTLLRLSLRFAK